MSIISVECIRYAITSQNNPQKWKDLKFENTNQLLLCRPKLLLHFLLIKTRTLGNKSLLMYSQESHEQGYPGQKINSFQSISDFFKFYSEKCQVIFTHQGETS